jgi:hypothetical protein
VGDLAATGATLSAFVDSGETPHVSFKDPFEIPVEFQGPCSDPCCI